MSVPAAHGAHGVLPSAGDDAEGHRADDALVRRVATGDREAFTALYDRMGGVAYGLARRVVTDSALADEVTQAAFLHVWLKAATFDPSRGSARTWILMITHRRAVDVVRREESDRDRSSPGPRSAVDPAYDVVVDRAELPPAASSADTAVSRALDALTPLQREAVELAYLDGRTCAQVAVALDVPLPTAKTHMRDGLIRLATEIRATPDIGQSR